MSKVYYHYTTADGAAGIAEHMVIRQSVKKGSGSGDDARFGEGVYLTTLGPEHGKSRLAWNNYDGRNKKVVAAAIRKGKHNCTYY